MSRIGAVGNEYVYGAYVAALRLLADCRNGAHGANIVLDETLAHLERVFTGEGLEEATRGARWALEALRDDPCRGAEELEEENYEDIRRALYAVAGLELFGTQSWRANQAALVLTSLKSATGAQRLSPRGSLLVPIPALYEAAQRWAAPPRLRETYYTIEPWRRIEIEHNTRLAIETLAATGVLVETRALQAYIVPAPYLEKEFIDKLSTTY